MNKKKSVMILKAAFAVSAAALVLVYPKEASDAAAGSIGVCINTIIPSMFIFMVITSYIRSSGLYRYIFRPVLWLLRPVIRADDTVLSVFILSMFGGYPVGIKLLKEMTEADDTDSVRCSENASMFCYCVSPSFALIMLGNGVFGSTAAGAVIYIADILACLLTGAAVSRIYGLRTLRSESADSGGIVEAVNSSSRALFTVCTVIIAFNSLLACTAALLNDFGIVLPPTVTGVLEISTFLGIKQPTASLIPFAAAVSSMGGICVLVQCSAIVKGAFPIKRFILARLPCSALSALLAWCMLQFVDVSVPVSAISAVYSYEFSANMIAVPVLVAMCIIIMHISDKILKKV